MSNYIKSAQPRLPVEIIVTLDGKEFAALFDAHIDSKEEFSVDTPNYPIEKDYDTTISTINHQFQLTMNLFLTPYPVTWASFFGRSIEMVKEKLIRMYWLHTPVKVRTQDETYDSMAIKSLTFKRSGETGEAYEVTAVFVHVQPTAFRIEQKSRGVVGYGGNYDPEAEGTTDAGKTEVEENPPFLSNEWFARALEKLGLI